MENNIRKIESKLDKHFENVDRSLGLWRERNKGGFFSRLSRVLSKKKQFKKVKHIAAEQNNPCDMLRNAEKFKVIFRLFLKALKISYLKLNPM